MFTSDKFIADTKRLYNKADGKEPEAADESKEIAEIRKRFFTTLSDLPEPMLHDIFNYYVEKYFSTDTEPQKNSGGPGTGPSSPIHIAEELVPVIDLLEECYDEKTRPLPPEDWPFIRDIVSDYGEELELSTISFIMTLVVDNKGFSQTD